MKILRHIKPFAGAIFTGPSADKNIRSVNTRIKLSILIFILYLALNIFHVGCPIKFLTGISCPGCGMTRAILSILQLHYGNAFYYHPLFFMAPFMLFLFIFEDCLRPGYVKILWIIIILLFILTYLLRLLLIDNNVVTIDLSKGLFVRLLHRII